MLISPQDRTDRNQPHRDFRTDQRNRAVGDLRPEDPQNRPNPDIEQTEPTGSASGSNPDFAAIQAGLIELSNQTRDRRADPEHSSEGERHPGSNRPRRVDGVRHDDVDGSQHQRHPQATDSTGAQVNSAISNPTAEAEKAKPKPIKRPQLQIRPRTERDVTPTAGELRETYRQKSTFGDKMGLDEIEKVGLELNRIYQQTHPDREKAPDDFRHPDVWIDAELLEVRIQATINIDPESKSRKRERNQDYGMSM